MSSTSGQQAGNADLSIPRELPPYAPGKAYLMSAQDGEIIYIPFSQSATRLYITGKETEDAFALVGSGGSQSDPIGFHYHNESHDVFLCLQGSVNVWAEDKCRTLSAGDFASVPPTFIHRYQILGDHSEMIGLIIPGGWEEFFRAIGDPYSGPMWPLEDKGNFFEVMLPRLKQAAEKFDMVPCPRKEGFSPQPWEDNDNCLPGKPEPYFLKSTTGPAYVVGGTVCRPLITTAESNNKFSIGSVESSNQFNDQGIFARDGQHITFSDVHHAFRMTHGKLDIEIGGQRTVVNEGELLYVPKGTRFRFRPVTRYTKIYVFCNGGGLVEMLQKLGKDYVGPVIPEKADEWDIETLKSRQDSFDGMKLN